MSGIFFFHFCQVWAVKAKILDLQPEKYGLSLDIKKCTTSGWALGDENVIGIRAFNIIIITTCTYNMGAISHTLCIYNGIHISHVFIPHLLYILFIYCEMKTNKLKLKIEKTIWN